MAAATIFRRLLGTCAGIVPQRKAPAHFGDEETGQAHSEEQEHIERRRELVDQQFGRDIGHQQHWNCESEERFEEPAERRVWQTRDVEQAVVTPDDALRPYGPEAHARQKEQQRVMHENPDRAEYDEAEDLRERRSKPQS